MTIPSHLPTPPSLEPLLSVQTVAGLLDVSPKTVYRHIWSGKLPHCKVGKMVRVKTSNLRHFIQDGER